MSINSLKEAAKIAQELSTREMRLLLLLQSKGIIVRAFDDKRQYDYIVSWDQITYAVPNPLLAAIQVVSAAFQEELTNES